MKRYIKDIYSLILDFVERYLCDETDFTLEGTWFWNKQYYKQEYVLCFSKLMEVLNEDEQKEIIEDCYLCGLDDVYKISEKTRRKRVDYLLKQANISFDYSMIRKKALKEINEMIKLERE